MRTRARFCKLIADRRARDSNRPRHAGYKRIRVVGGAHRKRGGYKTGDSELMKNSTLPASPPLKSESGTIDIPSMPGGTPPERPIVKSPLYDESSLISQS